MKINGERFNIFWKKVEEYFGQIPLVKYIFSNFTKGPVKHKGCFRLLVNWIIDFLISFGCIGLVASVLQIIMFICGFSLLFNMYNKSDDDYVDNDDEENNEIKNDENDEQK